MVRPRKEGMAYERRSSWYCCLLLFCVLSVQRTNAYDYNYNNPNNDGQQNINNYGNDDANQMQCYVPMSTCDESVVQVQSVVWYCNSQGEYYWGSSTHRKSKVCAINDKVTYQITYQVTDDIYDVGDIFVTMAVQDYSNGQILATRPSSSLCELTGSSCTYAGTYTFTVTTKLLDYSNNDYYDDFCPQIVMSFSTMEDSGYNLGALNMECEPWDTQFPAWADHQETPEEWLSDYGMLLGVGLCIIIFTAFIYQQAQQIPTLNNLCVVDPCTMELDQYYYYNQEHSRHGASRSASPYLGATTPQRPQSIRKSLSNLSRSPTSQYSPDPNASAGMPQTPPPTIPMDDSGTSSPPPPKPTV